jgi:hypothetical protein
VAGGFACRGPNRERNERASAGPAAEPACEVARRFPAQGQWSEADHQAPGTNRLVEYLHGLVEFLPFSTVLHQRILAILHGARFSFVAAGRLGEVRFAPLKVRLWPGKFRDPDLFFVMTEKAARVCPE